MRGSIFAAVLLLSACGGSDQAERDGALQLLNVSYDPTRELYREFNEKFVAKWLADTGEHVLVQMSHGGSGSQARAVIDGLNADIVTLALAWDIDNIQSVSRRLPASWQSRLPHNSSPYTSTIVFLVRKGNPKGIHDWPDLLTGDVQIITPNPKTSGGARWNYLAAWAWADKQFGGDQAKVTEFVRALYKNVPVLDSGARGSTITFAQRGIGQVLIAWENEAYYLTEEMGKNKFDIVTPSISILAEPSVAIVDRNVDKHGTRALAEAYLKFLYTPEGQELAAKHYYRPRDPAVAKKHESRFGKVSLVTIDGAFGGWAKAQKTHFADEAIFDKLSKPGS